MFPCQIDGTVLVPAGLRFCRHLLPQGGFLCFASCMVSLAARICASSYPLYSSLLLLQQSLHCLSAGRCLLLALGSNDGTGIAALAGVGVTWARPGDTEECRRAISFVRIYEDRHGRVKWTEQRGGVLRAQAVRCNSPCCWACCRCCTRRRSSTRARRSAMRRSLHRTCQQNLRGGSWTSPQCRRCWAPPAGPR